MTINVFCIEPPSEIFNIEIPRGREKEGGEGEKQKKKNFSFFTDRQAPLGTSKTRNKSFI